MCIINTLSDALQCETPWIAWALKEFLQRLCGLKKKQEVQGEWGR